VQETSINIIRSDSYGGEREDAPSGSARAVQVLAAAAIVSRSSRSKVDGFRGQRVVMGDRRRDRVDSSFGGEAKPRGADRGGARGASAPGELTGVNAAKRRCHVLFDPDSRVPLTSFARVDQIYPTRAFASSYSCRFTKIIAVSGVLLWG